MTRPCVLLAVLLVTPVLHADVLVVDSAGGGDFTTLTAAVAAAASGDTLLMRDGTYVEPGPVVIDGKALHVTGEWDVAGFGPRVTILSGLVIRNLTPNQRVVLQNLAIEGLDGTSTSASMPAIALIDNSSHVRVQSCVLYGGDGLHNAYPDGALAVEVASSLSTALVDCKAFGGEGKSGFDHFEKSGDGGPGVWIADGQVLISHGSATGGDGGVNIGGGDGGAGGAGVEHSSGSLLMAAGFAQGGDGGFAEYNYSDGGDGGPGLVTNGFSIAWLLGGSHSNGGVGGDSLHGDDGADGQPFSGPANLLTDFGGKVHGFDLRSPVREGQVGVLVLDGDPQDTTLVFASLAPHQLPLSGYQGVLLLAPTALLGPFVLGPPGDVGVPFVVPDLPVGTEALAVHVQPAYSGPDGVDLGPGFVLTLLDGAF
jgi:hypothetical protein